MDLVCTDPTWEGVNCQKATECASWDWLRPECTLSVSSVKVVFGKGRMALGGAGFDAIGGNLDLAVDDYLAHNVNYLRVVLGVKPPPFE